ncbi:MAG: hypothetical protein EOP56_02345 [Sphingobacteriales bacterium]|nr:MAG: hypothetical protein EOP56_02345 [Sphingobacteriales bacterium]
MTLTYEQAIVICSQHQFLLGRELCVSGKGCGIIEMVVVCPFDDINKYIFIKDLTEYGNPSSALDFYLHDLFDVLVVAKDYNGLKTLVTQDLRTYLLLAGIPFDPERYLSGQS